MTRAFDLGGAELPSGVTVLEASAGTGKTYTIAGLAVRYVAAGVPLEKLLLVSFTRMATSELRERVRERLASALRGEPADDPVLPYLEDPAARANVARALATFDTATIATTHAFCEEVLAGLGIAGDLERDYTFADDLRDLRAEVVDDLYVWRLSGGDPGSRPTYADAREIARFAAGNPATEVAGAPPGLPEKRRRTATWTVRELDARKRRMNVLTFDDLIVRLRDALRDRPEAVALLHARYDVVLIDEFQDTDLVQWEIMRTGFAAAGKTLVLIGDPKQAIYAFRGGDVYAYLKAAGDRERRELTTNFRADQPLIDAYDALFDGATLGHPDIAYLPVTAKHTGARLTGAPVTAPLRLRMALTQDLPPGGLTRQDWARAFVARETVAADVAGDIATLLGSAARIEDRPIAPADIAVLVPNRFRAKEVREALERKRVPAVVTGAGSVFGEDAAGEWLRLLEALERPSHAVRAHAAALTCFLGWDAARVAAADDRAWERVHDTLHGWARVLRLRGVAALAETITLEQGLPARVLAESGGERRLTDVRHVAQLLHGVATQDGLGPTALTAWLRRRVAEAEQDTADEDRTRRLESDAKAVQVLTVHRAKGLEFGVVYLPYLWDRGFSDDKQGPVVCHDDDGDRVLDVSLEGPGYEDHRRRWLREERGEDLRLLYVALTRARHQAVVWWCPTFDARNSALGRLVFGRDAAGAIPDGLDAPPRDHEATPILRDLKAKAPAGCISLERALAAGEPWAPPEEPFGELAAARFDRHLDTSWRRTSYSALTAVAHEAAVASEPEAAGVEDEPESGATGGLWADVPVGLRVGTAVHAELERLDFTAPSFGAEVTALGAGPGLEAALATPLGAPFGVRLADLAPADRLDELAFELPLAGGDAAAAGAPRAAAVTVTRLAAILDRHGDPYGARLAELGAAELRGFLTGSLDLVARLPDGTFAVFDYKTNGLSSFTPAALEAEMHHRHYGLQALLYTVALHRYLRWRSPGATIAGVGYLFLRGMDGASAGAGVFAWTPSRALVEEVSDALDG